MARARQLLLCALVVLHLSHAILGGDPLEAEINSLPGNEAGDGIGSIKEEAARAGISLDGIDASDFQKLTDSSEKHTFQAEVSRMMKLIINSLYRNKEVFLRELISNASDALDKIRVIALTIKEALDTNPDLFIRIKADKENGMLHITDSGVGMSRQELITNLGTIAKSGTADFLSKVGDAESVAELNDLIGQFGVGFYSAFLVADKVIVTSKSNDDAVQHIWESDSGSFTVVEDPRGDTLRRGTTISLVIKDEARDFLEIDTLRKLIQKYSQFINFPIYLWASKSETVEEPIEEEVTPKPEDESKTSDDEEGKVEEVKPEDDEKAKPKTKKVEKTTWDWELINTAKPIWQQKPGQIPDEDYNDFYKSITRDYQPPLSKIHFIAEGEVTFKALLYIPKVQPQDSFNKYGAKSDAIKLYVRRVFISDEFNELMPSYLSFIRGVVDSDDLPLNVARETLQQHKLLKVIRKKLIRKALDMIKKIPEDQYGDFWKEFSTNLKLGVIEDATNRQRLAKLLRFHSSRTKSSEWTTLSDYVKRMKEKQDSIYYIAGATYEEVSRSPFVERLLKRGFEVLYLTDAVDEYTLSNLPEFEGKKFQNVAKEGLKFEGDSEKQELIEKDFEPLTKWLTDRALKHKVTSVKVSQRLASSPAVLVASQFGWTGNMERLSRSNAHAKSQDATREYYLNQKKILEINPRHSIIRELLRRIVDDEDDMTARQMAMLVFETATLRSGYLIEDTEDFAHRVENLLRQSLNINDETIEDDDEPTESSEDSKTEQTESEADAGSDDLKVGEPDHDEL